MGLCSSPPSLQGLRREVIRIRKCRYERYHTLSFGSDVEGIYRAILLLEHAHLMIMLSTDILMQKPKFYDNKKNMPFTADNWYVGRMIVGVVEIHVVNPFSHSPIPTAKGFLWVS
jgi:hypothetical protein